MTEQKGHIKKKGLVYFWRQRRKHHPAAGQTWWNSKKTDYTVYSTGNSNFLNDFQIDIEWNSKESHKY